MMRVGIAALLLTATGLVAGRAEVPRFVPASVEPGLYVCFAQVPRGAGGIVMADGGSGLVWERVGVLAIQSDGTYRSADSAPAPFSYDPAGGRVLWDGGPLKGVGAVAGVAPDGTVEIVVHRNDGRIAEWRCRR